MSVARARTVEPRSVPTVDDLEATLLTLEKEAEDAASQVKRLKENRSEILVLEDDATAQKHDETIASYERQLDRARFKLERRRKELEQLREQEVVHARDAMRARVEQHCHGAREALEQYPELCDRINAIVQLVEAAKAEALAFNQRYPDEEPIADPEIEARRPAQETDIIESETTLLFWREVSTGQRVWSNDAQVAYDGLKAAPKDRELLDAVATGKFVPEPGGRFLSQYGNELVPVRYRKQVVLKAPSREFPRPLSESVSLPPLRPSIAKPERTREVTYLLVDEPKKERA